MAVCFPIPSSGEAWEPAPLRKRARHRAQETPYKSAAHQESYEVGSDSDRLNSTQGDADSAGQTRFVERSPRRVGLPGVFINTCKDTLADTLRLSLVLQTRGSTPQETTDGARRSNHASAAVRGAAPRAKIR